MITETASITASDGHSLDCVVVSPQSTPKGAVVVVQEIFGVTDQLVNIAHAYAKLGYIVAVPALFDRSEKGLVIPFDQGAKGRELMLSSKLENNMADIDAAVSHVRQTAEKVAVMGFCWGGGLALRAAQKLDINGAIVFYGTRITQYLDGPLRSPVLAHFGDSDTHVPAADLQVIQDYFPDLKSHVYQAGHAFANDARTDYVETAAELAHQRNKQFLDELFNLSA